MDESDQELHRNAEAKGEKKTRRRKKRMYKTIREQMEFYFSDSNLQKDRYLTNLLNQSKDGFIELNIFTRFNKIRALTTDIWEIRNALSPSEMLEVSEDGKQVRRTTPVEERQDTDECTIYVERLPPYANHDWLKSLFCDYGTVTYISLPRFKNTQKLKGFAFVEFDTPDAAKRACEHLGSYYEHAELSESRDLIGNTEELDDSGKLKEQEVDSSKLCSGKRKLEESEDEEVETKHLKTEDEAEESIEHVKIMQPEKENELTSEEMTEDNAHTIEIKKRRKHKKKPKCAEDVDSFMLRIMPKTEWKRWKNKYLALQKSTMSQIKRMLHLDGFYQPQQSTQPTTKENETGPNAKEAKQKNTMEFQPGVIICIRTLQPVHNSTDFKQKARLLGNVQYVDVSEGDDIAYIRCADSDSALDILKSQESSLGDMEILTGDDETAYWSKIHRDREAKLHTKSRQKKRGHEKIVIRAEKVMGQNKHIHFDD